MRRALSTESSEQRMLVASSGSSVLHVDGVVSSRHGAHAAWPAFERLKNTQTNKLVYRSLIQVNLGQPAPEMYNLYNMYG